MSLDPQPGSVISFGPPARRGPLRDLLTDRRLPGLTAGLGAVAVLGSLISEWQTTTISSADFGGDPALSHRMLPTDVIDLGAVGAGYLGGLTLLVITVVLALAGPEPGRRYARLAGLAVGGVLVALLLSLVHHLGETSLLIPRYFTMELSGDDIRVQPGRGLWCALAGVGAALLALRIPSLPAPEQPREAEESDPLDLTIAPATPFVSFPGEMDRPHRS